MIILLKGLIASARQRALLALALTAAVGLTEGLTLLLLIPLLSLAGVNVEGSASSIAEWLGSAFGAFGVRPTLGVVLAVYVVLTVMQASLVRVRSIADTVAVQNYALALRSRLYTAIARAEWLVLSRIPTSKLTFALTTAVGEVEKGAHNLLFLIATGVVALVYGVVAFRVSAAMSAIVIGATLLVLIAQRAGVALGRKKGEEVTATAVELYSSASEQLGGLKTAKSYGNETRHLSHFLDVGREINRAQLGLTYAFANLRWQTTVGSVIALSVILFLAVGILHLPTASILVLLFLFSRLVPRMLSLQQTYQEISSVLPALDTIDALADECERSPESVDAHQAHLTVSESIELRGVSFKYDQASTARQLADIDLVIEAGTTVAIVGASGVGKSTIADILLGLIYPTEGTVRIDDAELDRSHIGSWRSQVGYVAQETFLFNESVRFNLDWASPGASELDMREALSNAAALEFVDRLPARLDTVIGERGVRLSGGERQRLSLARALLRRPRVLILDEATSALDSENEERIYSAIQRLHGEMTIVVITHRLATVRNADRIYVVDEGRVVAAGKWDDLVLGSERFRQLALKQGIAG